jgi:alkylated DNA repair dioxygenase AlkB
MENIVYIDKYTLPNQISILEKEVRWENLQVARGESFMSDTQREYQYIKNGPVYKSIPFHPLVLEIMLKINNEFGYDLNVCFLNYYLDQTKALGWHADDSEPIDQSNPIAVISLGEKREIWTKPIDFKGVIPNEWRYPLNDGSLFIMPSGFQSSHKHKIPKGDRIMGSRISLTYRKWRTDY